MRRGAISGASTAMNGDAAGSGQASPRVVELESSLVRQRARGVLGPATLDALRAHSRGFALASGCVPRRAVDLGSGGGVPGLVLAVESWPQALITLLDASQRRCTYLEVEITALRLAPRVQAVWARAEAAGRGSARGGADVVVARSFASPPVAVECGAPLLAEGGVMVVSDPPAAGSRWDAQGLALLGLELERTLNIDAMTFTRLRQVRRCPERYPRPLREQRRHPVF